MYVTSMDKKKIVYFVRLRIAVSPPPMSPCIAGKKHANAGNSSGEIWNLLISRMTDTRYAARPAAIQIHIAGQ